MTASQTPGEPAELDALLALALREHRAGRLTDAVAAFRQILAVRPDAAEMHSNLGNVLFDQGKLEEAAAAYERATALTPSLFQTQNQLGFIFRMQGKFDQAVARFQQAIALRPDYAEAHHNLGIAFWEQGKLDQAVAQYEQALALKPDSAEAYNNLGNALKDQGKLVEAMAAFDRALALRPDYIEAHFHRSDLKTFRAGDSDLATLEALAADPRRFPPGNTLYLHFALGKALEDIGDYPRAFQHLLQANGLKRREVRYNEVAYQRAFQAIAETFDSSLLDRLAGAGDRSTLPVFIVGMPRSGTTLIEQILASHPQVQAAGELKKLNRVIQAVSDADGRPVPFPQSISSLDADGLRRLGQAYLASLPVATDGKIRITDKMPTNFAYVGLIRLILPRARIIHTMRDPVDTCVSCFSKHFNSGHTFSYDLAELGCYYRWYHELMDHWRSVLPAGAMLDVSYEAVVDNLEEQARRLLDYCGLPWDARCLSFHQTVRPVATASSVQVRQPLYRSSVERWRRYEAYLEPLLVELESCRGLE